MNVGVKGEGHTINGKILHLKNGKFAPQSDAEYFAILHLLNSDLFNYDYLPPEAKEFLAKMTEEEKSFVRGKIK